MLDYSDERKPKPPKPSRPITPKSPSLIDWQGLGQFGGNLVQLILIGLAVLGIAYGIFHMLRQPGNRTLQRASDGVIITEANLDRDLQETDLQRFLRAALESGNYALAHPTVLPTDHQDTVRAAGHRLVQGENEPRLPAGNAPPPPTRCFPSGHAHLRASVVWQLWLAGGGIRPSGNSSFLPF